jgi:hypothetical protein
LAWRMSPGTCILELEPVMKLEIEIYGVATSITSLRRVEIELPQPADKRDVLARLKDAVPALEGRVISSVSGDLMEGFTLNIDGSFYSAGMNKKIAGGEHIVLLALASGG